MQTQQEEIWKDVPGYEGYYQVSNLGNVKSLYREIIRKDGVLTSKKEVFLKYGLDKGYYKVNLSMKNKCKLYPVHQLVAMAFLGHKPCGYEVVVDHIDNIKTDNRVENLQLISNRENCSKDIKNKTSKYTGVNWCKRSKKWKVSIRLGGLKIYLGSFNNEKKASLAYEISLNNYNNFKIIPKKKVFTSKYKGVSFIKKEKKWRAKITINKEEIHLGCFDNEIDAHNSYSKALDDYKKYSIIPERIKRSSKYISIPFKNKN